MPAISPNSKILVTGERGIDRRAVLIVLRGASGFVAVWVVRSLLARGHTVRGTVRSPPKGEYLKTLFEKDFPGQFSYVIVKDITEVRCVCLIVCGRLMEGQSAGCIR